MINIIPIRNKPIIIIVTKFYDNYYHYHLNDLTTKNKHCDIGCWKIKYKQ